MASKSSASGGEWLKVHSRPCADRRGRVPLHARTAIGQKGDGPARLDTRQQRGPAPRQAARANTPTARTLDRKQSARGSNCDPLIGIPGAAHRVARVHFSQHRALNPADRPRHRVCRASPAWLSVRARDGACPRRLASMATTRCDGNRKRAPLGERELVGSSIRAQWKSGMAGALARRVPVVEFADLRYPPRVYFGHATGQFAGQVAARKVNVLERRSETPVACERSDHMQLPTSSRQIRQAKMPQRVGAEARDAGA